MIGLPTLRQLDGVNGPSTQAPQATPRIWLCVAPTDMRCGFDRLADLARGVTDQDPLEGHWFVFRSRGGDRLKLLAWDGDGFLLWYKRLEEGVFKLPKVEDSSPSVQLRPSELAMLLDGIDLKSVKRVKRYRRPEKPEKEKG